MQTKPSLVQQEDQIIHWLCKSVPINHSFADPFRHSSLSYCPATVLATAPKLYLLLFEPFSSADAFYHKYCGKTRDKLLSDLCLVLVRLVFDRHGVVDRQESAMKAFESGSLTLRCWRVPWHKVPHRASVRRTVGRRSSVTARTSDICTSPRSLCHHCPEPWTLWCIAT